jgi:hypothetical protein
MKTYVMSEGPFILHQLASADLRVSDQSLKRYAEEILVSDNGRFAYCELLYGEHYDYREVYFPYKGDGIPTSEDC